MSKADIMQVTMTMIAIVATGLALDEAGRGTFGSIPANFAKKVTRGYGQ